jgi:excisionase family DNA binding protein
MEQSLTLSVRDAAVLSGIGRDALYRLVQDGQIPHLKIGRRVLIPRAALEKWLNEEAARNARR